MMRGPVSWAVAVRKPDKEIAVEAHSVPRPTKLWAKWPFFRGSYVLVEQLKIGIRALMISANYQMEEEEERPSEKALGWTLGIAMVFFLGIFILAPALGSKLALNKLGIENPLTQNLVEGAIRIGFFVGYVYAISLIPDIRRVFQYHGAEHKTIYAYENDDPLEPEVVDKYTTLHVRCGTNFLFIVAFLTIVGHLILDIIFRDYSLAVRLSARVLAIPILAGMAYEVIKAASRNERSLVFRIASIPGLALQKITTRPPTRDQIEVAIRAMEAVIAREQLAEPDRAAAEAAEVADQVAPDGEPGAEPVPPT
jgi:uncharacterized protein YqhQ